MDSSPPGDPGVPKTSGSFAVPTPTIASPPSSASTAGDTTIVVNPSPEQLSGGQMLGERYRILRHLGRGGMGDVWQAYDLKLQVEVALKSIRSGRFGGDGGLELLRHEVRSARAVISPNVCRIFDLAEEGGREFVSMEYIDGKTLLELLRERAPLPIPEATRIAAQFLSGLEAIHQAGLVHRDVKPENIMITRTGRVLLMDFGIAKGLTEDQRGTIAGTPAYMAPEQARSTAIDARADIFAAGVTLAEMIAPAGLHDHTTRKSIWDAVRQEPVHLFESPWRRVLEHAVASRAEDRYASARELLRALEEVPQRIEGAEHKQPYPGLASFTEKDAEFFFGRELDVEAVWKKLQRTYLLAIVGASGAGKTSFLHAGLIPAMPPDWHHVVIRPGASPFAALGQALVPELVGDVEATQALVQLEDPKQAFLAAGRWRAKYGQVLLVCDQFEELFTLCRPDVQASFADLLGRLAVEADVHVLLSMRDDFLLRCHEHPRLSPIFSDLTPLSAPAGSALRRALVQPALLCGYRFDDESLADTMLDAVAGERGALPLVAFAALRLWENRDRERGLLTRAAYEEIGGVTGALAQHAEATLGRIGSERESIVREMFRNLVTSQGTRAVTEVDELLSVFADREAAGAVLRELVAARLLTTFEAEEGEGKPCRRVEVVHESLLAKWPRLVRWQTQDADGAQFRDQLRQQARLWNEHGRAEDLLWTGSSYREFVLWRERYPGALTAAEEQYAQAMMARAERLRRRRRRILVSSFTGLAMVVTALSVLWVRSQVANRRSEAARLLSLAQLQLPEDRSAAIAYAMASFELNDNPTVRRFFPQAIQDGPAAIVLSRADTLSTANNCVAWSPDGKWLVVGTFDGRLEVWAEAGGPALEIRAHRSATILWAAFSPRSNVLASWAVGDTVLRFWSIPEGRPLREVAIGQEYGRLPPGYIATKKTAGVEGLDREILLWSIRGEGVNCRLILRTCEYESGVIRLLGERLLADMGDLSFDQTGQYLAYQQQGGLYVLPLAGFSTASPRLVGRGDRGFVRLQPGGGLISFQDARSLSIWDAREPLDAPRWNLDNNYVDGIMWSTAFDRSGTKLLSASLGALKLWSLAVPRGSEASYVELQPSAGKSFAQNAAFHPRLPLIALICGSKVVLYPLNGEYRRVLRGHQNGIWSLQFTPDGNRLLTSSIDGTARFWTVAGDQGGPNRKLLDVSPARAWNAVISPDGERAAVATDTGVYLVELASGSSRIVIPPPVDSGWSLDFSVDGNMLAAVRDNAPCVYWLHTGKTRSFERVDGGFRADFLRDGSYLLQGAETYILDVTTGARRVIDLKDALILPDRSKRYWLAWTEFRSAAETWLVDPASWSKIRRISGSRRYLIGEGYFVEDDLEWARVGRVRLETMAFEESHLLYKPGASNVEVDPNGRWCAMPFKDGSILLIPIPEGTPRHLLPREELLRRLRTLTNLRAVRDPKVPTGYRVEAKTCPGWASLPTW